MSLKKVAQAKEDKGFTKADLVVYAVLAVLIAVVFLVVFISRDGSPMTGVCIYVKYDAVFSCDFTNGSYEILDDCVSVEEGEGGVLLVRVEAGGGFNLVEIDRNAPSVKVTEADCGRLDCVYTSAIVDNSGIIYCSPHGLRILPYDAVFEDDGTILF